jgi:hypothetical protein
MIRMTIFEFSLKTILVRLCHPLSESAHILYGFKFRSLKFNEAIL